MIDLNNQNKNDVNLNTILKLNDIVHSPVRLAILIFLLPRKEASFTSIKKTLELTAGNLSSHIKKLEEHRLVLIKKKFIDTKPTTIIILTDLGRTSILTYADKMSNVLQTLF